MKKILPALIISTLLQSTNAFAWGDDGHKIVASIAWKFMTPNAKQGVEAILANNKDILTPNNFVDIAPWPDKYRDAARPDGAAYIGTREWHFIDIPLKTNANDADIHHAEDEICPPVKLNGVASLGAPANDCITNKILQFTYELKDPKTSEEEKVFALKFLVHFVGDLHQPFHASDNNDHGGNCVSIMVAGYDKPWSLHSYWDSAVINRLRMGATVEDYSNTLYQKALKSNYSNWTSGFSKDWAAESFKYAKSDGYNINLNPLPNCDNSNKDTPFPITAEYEANAKAIAEPQLEKAGVRLAGILNWIYN